MHRHWRNRGLCVLFGLGFGLIGSAAAAACDLTATRTGPVTARMNALANCVADLQLENQTLRDALRSDVGNAVGSSGTLAGALPDTSWAVPAIGQHSGTRAVVAYTSETGQKSCPGGWEPYTPAADRFILGVGSAHPVAGVTGGEQTVKLDLVHMPTHAHAIPTDTIGTENMRTPVHTSNSDEGVNARSQMTGAAGSGKRHNNMPPFITLYFCVKS